MTGEVYEGSPLGALIAALDPGSPARVALRDPSSGGGRLGVLAARAGVGKSALLVHIALEALLREIPVLHVAVHDTVDSARAHYDEVFRAVAQAGAVQDWTSAVLRAERHRMIHSYLDASFDVALLRRNLDMLREVAHFEPKILLFDGFASTRALREPGGDAIAEHTEALMGLAAELNARIWVSVRTSNGLPESVRNAADVVLRLSQDASGVRLALTHRGDGADWVEAASLDLDPTTLLVRGAGAATPKARTRAGECTLYSGGARGSEEVFGDAAERYGVHEVNFTFDGHKQERTRGATLLTERQLAHGDVSLVYVSRRLNRTYSTEGGLIRRVLQTLWHMVSRSQQVFVIGKIQDDGTVVGGTGWSVELARMWNRELWVYDQDKRGWYRWESSEWELGTPTITTQHFTGTGTRYITEDGRAAIEELFARSFAP